MGGADKKCKEAWKPPQPSDTTPISRVSSKVSSPSPLIVMISSSLPCNVQGVVLGLALGTQGAGGGAMFVRSSIRLLRRRRRLLLHARIVFFTLLSLCSGSYVRRTKEERRAKTKPQPLSSSFYVLLPRGRRGHPVCV